jgi:outer membrane murein-binding lipoprotein Lpp
MTGDLKDILAIVLPTLIPSVTILVGVISNNKRLDDMSKRLDDMNARLNDLRGE